MLKKNLIDQTLTVFLTGDIDHHTAQQMRQEIDDFMEQCCCKILILDFAGVTFMDSSGIGLVMGRYKLVNRLGGTLQVDNLSSHIARIMRLAGLDQLAVLKK